MLKTIRTHFSPQEARRDRRCPLPIMVNFGGVEYTATDWSLGGFMLTSEPENPFGGPLIGTVKIPGNDRTYAFTAEIARRSGEGIGFRFLDLSQELFVALDRLAARYISRRVGEERA